MIGTAAVKMILMIIIADITRIKLEKIPMFLTVESEEFHSTV